MRIKEEYKEEYKQKITSIHRNIEDAIISYFSLCKIGEITKTFTFDILTMFCAQDSLNCLQTIITSLKKEFCLLVWCLCCDISPSANTIPKLKNKLNDTYLDVKGALKVKTPKFDSETNNVLIYVRKKYIAHHDFDVSFGRISLDDVFTQFSMFIELFNQLLVDGEMRLLYSINKSRMEKTKESCEHGVLQLLDGETYKFFETVGTMK